MIRLFEANSAQLNAQKRERIITEVVAQALHKSCMQAKYFALNSAKAAEQGGCAMMFAKIKFANEKEEARGVMVLLKKGRVRLHTVQENEESFFFVPESALAVLDESGIQYEVVGRGGWDAVVQALRSAPARKI